MVTRRLQTLAALAVGCAAGWVLCSVSGCALVFLATARADAATPATGMVITETCGSDGYVILDFPGSSADEIAANVYSVKVGATVPFGSRTFPSRTLSPAYAIDGTGAVGCAPGETVEIYIRQ